MTSLHDPERGEAGERGRDPRFRPGWFFIAALALWLVLIVTWAFTAYAGPRGASPTPEQVNACDAGLEALCDRSEPVSVELTREAMWDLEDAHASTRDMVRWLRRRGEPADCDWFIRLAAEALIAKGWPRGALIWNSGWIETKDGDDTIREAHAWLLVRTSVGVLALDVNRETVVDSGVLGYVEDKRCQSKWQCERMAR